MYTSPSPREEISFGFFKNLLIPPTTTIMIRQTANSETEVGLASVWAKTLLLIFLLQCLVIVGDLFFAAADCVCPFILLISGVIAVFFYSCVRISVASNVQKAFTIMANSWKGALAFSVLLVFFLLSCEFANSTGGRWSTPLILASCPLFLCLFISYSSTTNKPSLPRSLLVLFAALFLCCLFAEYADIQLSLISVALVVVGGVCGALIFFLLDLFLRDAKQKYEYLWVLGAGSCLLFALPILSFYGEMVTGEKSSSPIGLLNNASFSAVILLFIFGGLFGVCVFLLLDTIRSYRAPLASSCFSLTSLTLLIADAVSSSTSSSTSVVFKYVCGFLGFAFYGGFVVVWYQEAKEQDHQARRDLAESHTQAFEIVEIQEDDLIEEDDNDAIFQI